jgi:archaellum component FlaF (FlaF/FlaG flagellin family)
MTFEKTQTVDFIEVFENGCVQIRTKTSVMEDGNLISSNFQSLVIAPGDDYSGKDTRVQGICRTVHTAEIVAAYKATIDAQKV